MLIMGLCRRAIRSGLVSLPGVGSGPRPYSSTALTNQTFLPPQPAT